VSKRLLTTASTHDISGATLAQFLYVAAQAGIFSFLINYMTSEPPGLPASWLNENTRHWIELRTAFAGSDFRDLPSLAAKLRDKADPVSAYLASNLSSGTLRTRALRGICCRDVAGRRDADQRPDSGRFHSPERLIRLQRRPAPLPQDVAARNEMAQPTADADAYRRGVCKNPAVSNWGGQSGIVRFHLLLGRRGVALRRYPRTRSSASSGAERGGLLPGLSARWVSVVCVFLSHHVHHVRSSRVLFLACARPSVRRPTSSWDGRRGSCPVMGGANTTTCPAGFIADGHFGHRSHG
jgi:hypothetical protein